MLQGQCLSQSRWEYLISELIRGSKLITNSCHNDIFIHICRKFKKKLSVKIFQSNRWLFISKFLQHDKCIKCDYKLREYWDLCIIIVVRALTNLSPLSRDSDISFNDLFLNTRPDVSTSLEIFGKPLLDMHCISSSYCV